MMARQVVRDQVVEDERVGRLGQEVVEPGVGRQGAGAGVLVGRDRDQERTGADQLGDLLAN
jgi:hypothetical protein